MENLTLTITLCILIVASCTDIQYQKVPNIITFPGILIGLICSVYPYPLCLIYKIGWLIIYMVIGSLRIMGMGDLKLCMAVLALRDPIEAAIMLLAGTSLLFLYCLATESKNMVETLMDTVHMLFYQTGPVKRSENIYPFAVFLALGYSFNFMFF